MCVAFVALEIKPVNLLAPPHNHVNSRDNSPTKTKNDLVLRAFERESFFVVLIGVDQRCH